MPRGPFLAASAAVACAALLSGRSGRAEEPRPPDAMEALVAEALERNPDVLEARAALDAARQRPAQAGTRPDPIAGVVYTNDGWVPSLGGEDMTTLALMGSQELPYPGKRALRRSMATLDIAGLEARLARRQRTVAAAVARAYWQLALARALEALLGDERALWQRVEESARALYAAGPGPQLDVLRAQAQSARVEEQRIALATDARIRQAEVNRLLAREPEEVVTPQALGVVDETRSLAALAAAAEAASPELAASTAAIERERLAVALARRDFRPDFTVQGAYMNRGLLPPMWQAGVTASVPLDRTRRRAALAEGEARLRAAEARENSVRLTLRLRTEERHARLLAAERLDALYRDTLVPQGRAAVESALATYGAGVGSQTDVLGTLRALMADRADHLRVLARHLLGRVALDEASVDDDAGDMPTERAPMTSMEAR